MFCFLSLNAADLGDKKRVFMLTPHRVWNINRAWHGSNAWTWTTTRNVRNSKWTSTDWINRSNSIPVLYCALEPLGTYHSVPHSCRALRLGRSRLAFEISSGPRRSLFQPCPQSRGDPSSVFLGSNGGVGGSSQACGTTFMLGRCQRQCQCQGS